MSGVLAASDLDRTLVYSAASLHLPGTDEDAPALVVAEVYQGAPLSFLTRTAWDGLVALAASSTFVPVTTRTRAQFARVRLPRSADDWAVTTNGGVLLHHGRPDASWSRSMEARVRQESAPLSEVRSLLAGGGDPILRIRDAEDLFVYAIVDRATISEGFVSALTARCADIGWRVSLQGRKLYCVPTAVSKADAVSAVAERVGADTVVAAGDSLLDQVMLERADRAVRPRHGELEETGFTAPHCSVTDADGVIGGEQVVARMRSVVAEARRPAA